jgi:O-antigen/teichoic acid export membrane protein
MVVAVLVRRRFISLTTFDRKLLWASLVFGFPLVGYELAGVILDSGGRIVVQQYLGFEAVGYYSAGYNIANYVSQLLMVPVNLALFPIYMRLWVTKGREETQWFLSSALDNFLMAGMCVMAGVIVSAHDAVIFLGSQKLMAAYPLLPILVGGLMLYSLHIFFNAGLLIYKRTLTMAKLIASAATLNIVLNIVLIPLIGLMGAAVATLLGYAAFIGLMIRASSKVLPLRFDMRASLRYALAAGISVLLASRFHCPILLANLLVRGTLCLLVYGAVLYGIDNHFRLMVTGAVRYAKARRQKSGAELTRTAA